MQRIYLLFLLTSFSFSETYLKGLTFDDEAYATTPKTAKLLTRDFELLPSQMSLQKYAPSVGNQGKTGTCTAWATAYGARTILDSILNKRTSKSEIDQQVFSPSYVYNQIRLKEGCKGGSYIHHALDLIQTDGVAKLKSFKFICEKTVTPTDKSQASTYKIKDYKKLFDIFDTNKIQPIKKALSQKKPVIIGMNTPDSFSNAKNIWYPKENDYKQNFGGHAMVVIAYDDNKHGGSFQFMNSWGDKWGDKGLTWIRYTDFKHFVKYAYEMIPSSPPLKPIKLAGKIKFMDSMGRTMKATYNNTRKIYQMNKSYFSGTKFNFFMTNLQPAYLYAFGFDNTQKTFTIFPHRSNISAFLGYTNSSIAFPDEKHYIQMDNTKGKDYFIILYSKDSLDIEDIQSTIESKSGSIEDRLQIALKQSLVNSNQIYFSDNTINFKYESGTRKLKTQDSVVAVIIEFNHIGQ